MLNLSKNKLKTLLFENVVQYNQIRRKLFATSTSSSHNVKNINNQNDSGVPFGIMGQPTCHTHPHIVGAGELVPGITVSEFVNRRNIFIKNLVSSVPNRANGHTVIIPSAAKNYMSDKIPYIFRQSSDFFYLTGCLEPNCVLILSSLPDSDTIHESVLLLQGKDEHSELWDGPRTSFADAVEMFKVKNALPYIEFNSFLARHLSECKNNHLWYLPNSPIHQEVDTTVREIISLLKTNPPACPQRVLAQMRVIKSPAESKLMLAACKTSSAAINNAMACTKPGTSEHDIHASIDYWCRRAGAEHLAFPPVIGGGQRATAIHYIHDNQVLSNGELLLVDSGCQRYCYNSDITRTWPVSGKYSKAQAILYDIVAAVQSSLISTLQNERPSLDKLFNVMCYRLASYLREEGIIPKTTNDSELIAMGFKFCPHHVSHYLGLDVHDTPLILRSIRVQPGMVVTVEPGIYINANDKSVPKEFRGIGIRIEDDVLITDDDLIVMTESCMKDRREIEKIVGTKSLPQ